MNAVLSFNMQHKRTYFIMINMSSTPSPSKNNFLISGSASAEQSDVKQFSMSSASSSSAGSLRLYDCKAGLAQVYVILQCTVNTYW